MAPDLHVVLLHVVPASGAQTVIVNDGRLYQDAAVRSDGKFAAINLPSAGPSGVFLIDHDGTTTKFNTGTHFGDGPTGIVIGKDGHFYVSHLGTPMVIRVDKNSGAETVVAQGGKLQSPSGIARSKDGHLLVSDFGSDAVIHVDPANGHQSIVTQGGHLKSPFDIAVEPNGNIPGRRSGRRQTHPHRSLHARADSRCTRRAAGRHSQRGGVRRRMIATGILVAGPFVFN